MGYEKIKPIVSKYLNNYKQYKIAYNTVDIEPFYSSPSQGKDSFYCVEFKPLVELFENEMELRFALNLVHADKPQDRVGLYVFFDISQIIDTIQTRTTLISKDYELGDCDYHCEIVPDVGSDGFTVKFIWVYKDDNKTHCFSSSIQGLPMALYFESLLKIKTEYEQ